MSGLITVCSVPARAAPVPQPSCATRELQPGDLVLRKNQNLEGLNKMSSKWEGPFRVTHTLRPVAVYLEDEKGRPEGNAWNIENLRKFYP